MPNRAKDFLMRVPDPRGSHDWFRIENKKDSKGKVTSTDIHIYDEIGFWGTSAAEFTKQLAAIDTEEINLHINSPGGEIFDGIAIYNGLKAHKAKVNVIVDSLAASAASFIAQAGDTVQITRNGTMMIHDGIAFTYGNAKDHQDSANLLDKLSNNIADIYAQRAGGDVTAWRDVMREEAWYNAQEAVDAGLADEVVEVQPSQDEPAAENKFSLISVFNYSGRNEAPSPEKIRQRVINRVKEARMTTPVNGHEDGTPEEEPVRLAGQPVEEEDGNSPDGSQPAPPVEVGEVPVSPGEATQPAAVPQQENRVTGSTNFGHFMVNGVATSDLQAVQNHINVLEGAVKETREANRKGFVTNLAGSGRIAATQLDKTIEFALKLNEDQYESWVASWDAAPSLPLFGDHAARGQYGPEATGTAKAENDSLETAKEIIATHKRAGMAHNLIKETPSYKMVIAHDPEFQL